MPDLPQSTYPPIRILLGPGPSDVHPRVLAALAAGTVGHLDPFYLARMTEMQQMLRQVLRTENEMTLAISGTGSAGMEAAVVNLIEPGEPMVVCAAGVFGDRLAQMALRAGADLTRIDRPWGEVFTPDDLKAALVKSRPKVVGLVMVETSTGALQPIEELVRLAHDAGALVIVDAVTSLGGMPVETDAWGLDAVVSCSQKCLGAPPGLAPLTFGPRAMEKIRARRSPVRSWYLDVSLLAQYWGQDRVYHHTAPINMTFALYEALRMLLEEGLPARHARHALHGAALKAGLKALGLRYVVADENQPPMVHAIHVPEGVNKALIRRNLLERFGIEVGGGLGALKGKAFRIGIMGHGARAGNVLMLLAALEQLLAEQKYRFEPGCAVAAANRYYSASAV